MDAEMTEFGRLSDGTLVHAVTLGSDRLQATVLTHGARLHALSLDSGPNVMVAPPDLAGYEGAAQYAGPVVGPVVNRLAEAQAKLDGVTYQFEANQDGRHCLHSGQGTHGMVWEVAELAPDHVALQVTLVDGLGGFPGNRVIEAVYRIDGADLHLILGAKTDAPTFMNLAHHGVWSMDGNRSWNGHRLWVGADRYLPTGEGKIPTGEIAPVADSLFDHCSARAPDPGLDHNFCFEPDGVMRMQARLTGTSGRFVEVHSTAPGLQVYAGGAEGIALEPQLWPDAPNQEGFPSIILRPVERFEQRTIFRLGQE